MDKIDSRLSRMDRKIVESVRGHLPEISKKECPACSEGTCERAGGPCAFRPVLPCFLVLKNSLLPDGRGE